MKRVDYWLGRKSMYLTLMCALLLSLCGHAVAADDSPAALASPTGLPARLVIPAIGIDAVIESVGLTPDGAMDVPRNFDDVAWYQLGPRPGDPGNAVIDGHVDSAIQGTAVFWRLRDLRPGDAIIVIGDDGSAHRFIVTGTERYDDAHAPIERIFGDADSAHLNLITCDSDSAFDKRIRSYLGSMVVYADAATPAP